MYNCSHLTCYQSNAQNSPGQASTVHSCELPDVQAGFRNGRGTRDRVVNIHWIIEKAREFHKNSYFCFIDYTKALTVGSQKLWKILQEMGIPDPLTCLLRNMYADQESTEEMWNHRLVPNWARNTSRLYTVTLHI